MSEFTASEAAKKLYQQSMVIDLQLGFEPEIEAEYKWDILSQFAASGFNLVSLAVATDATSLEKTVQFIAQVRAEIQSESNYIIAGTVGDIEKAKSENKMAVSFLLQGPNPISKNLDMLDVYYQLGVRSMILAYNIRNPFADGCIEPEDAGLSRLGKQLVQKMNKIGMLIDVSHTGYRSSLEAIALSEQPVIFSHSNVYALHAHPRNLKDEQIKAISRSGGVIGLNGNAVLLGKGDALTHKFVEHIDYIAQLAGPEFIALGTDWIYFPELFNQYMSQQAIFYSSSYQKGLTDQKLTAIEPQQIIEVVELLLQRGYSEENIQGILGENYLRVIRQVWQSR